MILIIPVTVLMTEFLEEATYTIFTCGRKVADRVDVRAVAAATTLTIAKFDA